SASPTRAPSTPTATTGPRAGRTIRPTERAPIEMRTPPLVGGVFVWAPVVSSSARSEGRFAGSVHGLRRERLLGELVEAHRLGALGLFVGVHLLHELG